MADTAHGSARSHLALEKFLPYRLSILSNTVSNVIAVPWATIRINLG